MARPLAHHRSPEFDAIYGRVLAGLKRVFRTSSDVLLFAASGTGAFESAYANLLSPGSRVLVVTSGHFGDRWVAMGEAFGARVEALRFPWGSVPDSQAVANAVAGREDLEAVVVVHSETSTGAVADLRRIAELTRGRSALLVVDAISSLGAAPLETDGWGLDVVVTGSQKALLLPPGLSFAAVSERALERSRVARNPRFYFDWSRTRKAQAKGTSPFTPAISLVAGLDVALARIEAEGLEAAWERTERLGGGLRAAMAALGLELFSPDLPSCSLVTAVRVPEGVSEAAVRRGLQERHAVFIAGGQGQLAGRIWRFSAFGAIDVLDLVRGLAAFEQELARAGFPVELGTGVGAFMRALERSGAPV